MNIKRMSSKCRSCKLLVCRCKVTITHDRCGGCGYIPDYCQCMQTQCAPSPLPVYVSAAQSADVNLSSAVPTTLQFNDIKSLSRQMCDTQYGMWMTKACFSNGVFTIPSGAAGFYSVATNVSVSNTTNAAATVTVQIMLDNTAIYSGTKILAAGSPDTFHLGGGIALAQNERLYVVVTSSLADVVVNKLGTNFSAFFSYHARC